MALQQVKEKQVSVKDAENLGKSEYPKSKEVECSPKRPLPPFLQRVKKGKEDLSFKNFFDTFRELRINLPLLDVSQGMPKYAKYFKAVVTNKTKLQDIEIVILIDMCSSVVISKMTKKLKDPGIFTLPK